MAYEEQLRPMERMADYINAVANRNYYDEFFIAIYELQGTLETVVIYKVPKDHKPYIPVLELREEPAHSYIDEAGKTVEIPLKYILMKPFEWNEEYEVDSKINRKIWHRVRDLMLPADYVRVKRVPCGRRKPMLHSPYVTIK